MLESLNYSFRNPKNIIWVIYRIKQLRNDKKKNHGVLRGPQLDKQRWWARLGILWVKLQQKPEIMKKSWNFALNDVHFLEVIARESHSIQHKGSLLTWRKERQGLTELRAIGTVPGMWGNLSQTYVRHTSVSGRTRAVESGYSVMTGPSICAWGWPTLIPVSLTLHSSVAIDTVTSVGARIMTQGNNVRCDVPQHGCWRFKPYRVFFFLVTRPVLCVHHFALWRKHRSALKHSTFYCIRIKNVDFVVESFFFVPHCFTITFGEYELIYQLDAIEYLFVYFELDMCRAYTPIFRSNGC